ncbi:MAG: SiaB family protein kinase [Bacteroidales bacterium]|nr:SiaB family protein kinase [Bacteroidales bacterium]
MDLIRIIRDKIMEERLMLVYRGVITADNSIPLLMLLEKEMEDSEFGFLGRKRVFLFVLESLQNVSKHTHDSWVSPMSLVIYSKHEGGYTVVTGNVIDSSGISTLKSKLDEINKLDSKEIREVYKLILNTSEFNSKGGAGLGLIEMARTTGSKLDYDFVNTDADTTYFVLTKSVDSKGIGIPQEDERISYKGENFRKLEKLMSENNVYLIWSGHISPEVAREVLTFTETKLSEEDIEAKVRRRVFSILVEILENVAKYGPDRKEEEKFGMPVAIIRFDDGLFLLSTGNLVLNNGIDDLRQKLDTVNEHNNTELKDLFIKSLIQQDISTDSTGDMGLIDVARKSGEMLEYQFEYVNEDYSYFTLTVKVANYI